MKAVLPSGEDGAEPRFPLSWDHGRRRASPSKGSLSTGDSPSHALGPHRPAWRELLEIITRRAFPSPLEHRLPPVIVGPSPGRGERRVRGHLRNPEGPLLAEGSVKTLRSLRWGRDLARAGGFSGGALRPRHNVMCIVSVARGPGRADGATPNTMGDSSSVGGADVNPWAKQKSPPATVLPGGSGLDAVAKAFHGRRRGKTGGHPVLARGGSRC